MFKINRKPDFVIGNPKDPYMLRWYIIPRNRFFNIYLHKFLRSDDDRALHDHPWYNMSFILKGGYWEHLPIDDLKQKTKMIWRKPYKPYFRKATDTHRIELELDYSGPVWSLFITGPKIREWGFYCPKGWVHFTQFISVTEEGNDIGRGCE